MKKISLVFDSQEARDQFLHDFFPLREEQGPGTFSINEHATGCCIDPHSQRIVPLEGLWYKRLIVQDEVTIVLLKKERKKDDALCHAYAEEPTVGPPGCTLPAGHEGNHRGGELKA